MEAAAMDNVATNEVLIQALSRLLMEKFNVQFAPENSQIRCLAHVLLAALEEAEDPAKEDDYLPNKDLLFHYDPALDDDLIQREREEFGDDIGGDNEDEIASLLTDLASKFEAMSPLQKLRTTTTKICSSPQRRKRFRAAAEKAFGNDLAPSSRKLASLSVVRDVRHRWNYTQAMIERARLLSEPDTPR
ncbi:hypothetical protein B0H16DRAFT_1720168 [Mycena metata]|uniref:Uncharacterized protein n=1 Tax=Mycena metata TaxID=1033252 RepID=A0AAD7J9I4_9AGAR|nr:hypothetical protein B0H16DRAFT_1720168 [Mycena metata]